MGTIVKGKVSEIAGKVLVGELKLDQAMLSVITRVGEAGGWAKVVGEERLSGKGKPSKIWEIDFPFAVTLIK